MLKFCAGLNTAPATNRNLSIFSGMNAPSIQSVISSQERKEEQLDRRENYELEEGEIYEGEAPGAFANLRNRRYGEHYPKSSTSSRYPEFHPSRGVFNKFKKLQSTVHDGYRNYFPHKSAHKRHREHSLGMPWKKYFVHGDGKSHRDRFPFRNDTARSHSPNFRPNKPPACIKPGDILLFIPNEHHKLESDPGLGPHYQVILDDKYKVEDLPDHFATLVITTHPVTDIAIPLQAQEDQLEPETPSLFTFEMGRDYEMADGQNYTTRCSQAWRKNTCIGIQTPKLIHENTLHVPDSNNPRFRRRLTPMAFRTLLLHLDHYLRSQHGSGSYQSSDQSSQMHNLHTSKPDFLSFVRGPFVIFFLILIHRL